MKLFECQSCGQLLYFENTLCLGCGRQLGYLPPIKTLSALEVDGPGSWRALADPERLYRPCWNAVYEVCNWLIPADDPQAFCTACRHNRTIPNLSQPQNAPRWRKIEVAKHRLFYTLVDLGLPLVTRMENPDGLAFDFLENQFGASAPVPVMTGHVKGVITVNVEEADDAERERRRGDMGEPYRTLLGHFRHEIAHYYWDCLIADSPSLEEFRRVFGDERTDYSAALARHYSYGPPSNWPENFVTAYASSHPWEDFAETWAHYFHMVDTLETAAASGVHVVPRIAKGRDLAAKLDFEPQIADIDRIISAWLPLTFAVNSINRSMGLHDLYPFVLGPGVIVKLTFVHECIRAARNAKAEDARPAPWSRCRDARVIRPIA